MERKRERDRESDDSSIIEREFDELTMDKTLLSLSLPSLHLREMERKEVRERRNVLVIQREYVLQCKRDRGENSAHSREGDIFLLMMKSLWKEREIANVSLLQWIRYYEVMDA
jgi:hypothetical protein